MLTLRDRDHRGPTDAGWLKSKHSFSFGHYYDPHHMGFGPLRVINEDWVIPGAGFQTHGHDNMEIITYVLSGSLSHKDSMGNGSTIRPGDIQLMSAGTGVQHSEFNASKTEEVHLLQIWIMPQERNVKPSYQQEHFPEAELKNQFRVVISPDGVDNSLRINQDARILAGRFDAEQELTLDISPDRRYWVQIAKGLVEINGEMTREGDGLAIRSEDAFSLRSVTDSEILVFDLP